MALGKCYIGPLPHVYSKRSAIDSYQPEGDAIVGRGDIRLFEPSPLVHVGVA
jgi:hypothetical protein